MTQVSTKEAYRITFDVNDRDFDEYERLRFWESLRPWLCERGYTLYHPNYVWEGKICDEVVSFIPCHEDDSIPQHPYSVQGGTNPPGRDLVCLNLGGRVISAQDKWNRHVSLRLVKDASDEYKILRRISEEPGILSQDSFDCVIPVLDFLPLDGHWVVVMPRWGVVPFLPEFESIGEVLNAMRCLLKGLCFLRSKLIVHRDIKSANIVVNHIGFPDDLRENSMRKSLRREGKLVYCWIDFDSSVIFPSTSTLAERRLECGWYTIVGGGNYAYDVAQGELDYDPFAYDIGSLGQLFCQLAQHLTPIVPMLAPFLDMMITRDIPKRFTAPQALQFLEDICASITPAQFNVAYPPVQRVNEEKYDRWRHLPSSFVQQWSTHRAPTNISYFTRFLRWVCQYKRGYVAVQRIRRMWRDLSLQVPSAFQRILKGRIVAKQIEHYCTVY
ncbi:hypothetical protein Hypma_000978 [Hypsizygus marmoreus]|uniref:Protein kinase domain-containing protein n=1 Tax=Hypsizygus marmoreus TaxID=39966 RepID=A0A369J7Q7_HYPMA|nr:hypothetical protein Hypma_000978 [Hypsizygus marmoreus]